MFRFLPLAAALLLVFGSVPAHAQEADTSAAEPPATDTAQTDTTQAEAVPTDTTQTDSLVADSAGVVADTVSMSPEERARAAAESWLVMVDSSEFGNSWDAAAPSLQDGLTREQWITRATRAREQLQGLQSRRLRSSEYRDSTAQLPGGPVTLLQYYSTFDGGTMLEAVITTRPDSVWKVAGYRVVPAPDSIAAPDSVAARDSGAAPDSVAAPDSAAPPDSIAVPDSTDVPSDTTEVPSDTTEASGSMPE